MTCPKSHSYGVIKPGFNPAGSELLPTSTATTLVQDTITTRLDYSSSLCPVSQFPFFAPCDSFSQGSQRIFHKLKSDHITPLLNIHQ